MPMELRIVISMTWNDEENLIPGVAGHVKLGTVEPRMMIECGDLLDSYPSNEGHIAWHMPVTFPPASIQRTGMARSQGGQLGTLQQAVG
jgi:hypothetical protein